MKEIKEIKLIKTKIKAKSRYIERGWNVTIDEKGTLRMWYEKPVDLLPDELFEI